MGRFLVFLMPAVTFNIQSLSLHLVRHVPSECLNPPRRTVR
jgi:hypothetical protein